MSGYQNFRLFPPGLEPGTFRVLGERDNHYTTETGCHVEGTSVLQSLVGGLVVPKASNWPEN